MGGTAVFWMAMFVNRSANAVSKPSPIAREGLFHTLAARITLASTTPFSSRPYRGSLILILGMLSMALVAGLWQQRRRASSAAVALIATSAICFVLSCVVPTSINGSDHFPDRFPIFWVTFLIAGVAALRPPGLWDSVAGGIAAAIACAVLMMQWNYVGQISRELQPVFSAPVAQAGAKGLIVSGDISGRPGLKFDPFYWSGAHYFRRSIAILANEPWMDLPIIMIRPEHPDRWSYLDPNPAAQTLGRAIQAGDRVTELSLILREGKPVAAESAVMRGANFSPLRQDDTVQIYERRPIVPADHALITPTVQPVR